MRLLRILLMILAVATAVAGFLYFKGATRPAPATTPGPYAAGPERPPGGLEVTELRPCEPAPGFIQAAVDNARSLHDLVFEPFRSPETGWETYAPQVAEEIGTACAPNLTGFAAALARWQAAHGLPADGRMTPETFQALNVAWHRRRPLRGQLDPANCPAPPPPEALATATPAEGYGGKAGQLRPPVLDALRRMRAAARAEDRRIAADPQALTIVSSFREPEADALNCLLQGNCDNVRKSACSAHRTGLAIDLYVGQAPGYGAADTAAVNRLYQSKTPAYRWLVRNARRFGFVNYVFEPWHWEWSGERAVYDPATADKGTGLRPGL
ncbi:MAG: D-alanyl-D-alanine carboxypeptidase family protein [Caulobacteraceae bacterium]